MNFAYINAQSLLESVLAPPPEPIEPVPCELDERWKEFGLTLARFKGEYTRKHAELSMKIAELREKREEVDVLKMMLENVSSQGLKEKLSSLVQEYEDENHVDDLKRGCAELSGLCNAMKDALLNTGADRYGKFTCFVCMDRLVDLFMDPCGHVMCEQCWLSTRDKTICPGCRQHTHGARKIYTM